MSLCLFASGHLFAQPAIQITNLPPFGSFQDLGGVVLNANPASYRVAVFIFVPGAGWYTKPTCGSPLTTIQPNGNWLADITTGGSDQLATKIAALLVTNSYNQPCVLGPPSLPTNVTAQAIASVIVDRDDPSIRRFDFGGYNWWVKSSTGVVGPGPNYFSDSTNNVWLDASNRLHLRITNRSNQWQCAEVVTRRSFGHGQYRFQLDSRVDNLDPSVVLGLFTWSDDPAYDHREIDVECSRWGWAGDPSNAQFVVQPFNLTDHLVRYTVPTNAMTAHVWSWETNRVTFQAQRGTFVLQPAASNIISAWTYTNTVPPAGDENVRLNLWLYQGSAPTDANEVEVIIRNFRFVPFGDPRAARFTNAVRAPGGPFHVELSGEFDRFYRIEGSTNLTDWQPLAEILATNATFTFTESSSGAPPPRKYYRAVTLP
ncbi:MAG: hypothetical protein EXS35_01320 [Pedosphaera sp.]|nr:hypothetical protein [Pedosphaera sp.]